MGTWNTEILGNDEAMDIYGFFENLYNKQELDIETIKQKVLLHFRLLNEHNQPVFGSNEWLAYALICWECKALDEQTLNIVKEILQDKEDIQDNWEDLAEKRIAEIEKFLIKIKQPAKRKKTVKIQYIVNVPFQEGDCILVKNEDGVYSVVILLEIDKNKEEQNMWTYVIGTTRIYQTIKPTFDDVINSHFLVVNYGKTLNGEDASWYKEPRIWISGGFIGTVRYEKDKLEKEFQISRHKVIGNLKFINNPNTIKSYGIFGLDNSFHLKTQTEWEKEHPTNIDLSYPIKKYIETKQPEKKKVRSFGNKHYR